jgi:hypothetical protein
MLTITEKNSPGCFTMSPYRLQRCVATLVFQSIPKDDEVHPTRDNDSQQVRDKKKRRFTISSGDSENQRHRA